MMNDLGLYSGWSESLKHWADLVDDILVHLKGGASVFGRPLTELQQLITSIAGPEDENLDFSDQRIANMLTLEIGKRLDWVTLAQELSAPKEAEQLIPKLEIIAQCLSREHSRTVAKMRWRQP